MINMAKNMMNIAKVMVTIMAKHLWQKLWWIWLWLTDQRLGNGSSPPVSRRAVEQCLGAEKTNMNQLARQIWISWEDKYEILIEYLSGKFLGEKTNKN